MKAMPVTNPLTSAKQCALTTCLTNRLVRPGAWALAIGLGVGTAISGLQQHGIVVDVIELHEEVPKNRAGA